MVKGKIASNLEKKIENDKILYIGVKTTPFGILKDKEKRIYRIVIGNNIISENEFTSIEKAYNYIMKSPWELITNVILLFIEKSKNLNVKNDD